MNKTGHFKSVTSENKVEAWRVYLDWQVKLFADQELNFLKTLGFGEKTGPIVDLGCGPGIYTKVLAKHFAEREIVAADTNQHLLDIFNKDQVADGSKSIQIVCWTATEEPLPASIKESKTVLMRYVAQHQPNTVEFLKKLKKTFAKGTEIFFVEEDDHLYLPSPELRGLNKLLSYYETWADSIGSYRDMGKRLPRLLADAGFKIKAVELLCHSGMRNGIGEFLNYYRSSIEVLESTVPGMLNKNEILAMQQSFDNYEACYATGCLLYYPQVITVATI